VISGTVAVVTRQAAVRLGRRPGESGSREAILGAAAARFAKHGFQATTVRGVAADAGVDAALVHHFFGGKENLFVQAMALPVDPAELIPRLLEPGLDGLGDRLIRTLLGVFDELGAANPMLALVRSATSHPAAARMVREFLGQAILDRLAAAIAADRPQLRAALCASQIVGLLVAREIVALPALAAADADDLAAAYGPALQHYLTGDLTPTG